MSPWTRALVRAARCGAGAVLVGALLLAGSSSGAQSGGGTAGDAPAARPPAAHPAPHTSVADIGPRAEETRLRLRRMVASMADDAAFAALEADVSALGHDAGARWEDTEALLAGASRRRIALVGLADDWHVLGADLELLGKRLAEGVRAREGDLATLAALRRSWTGTRQLALHADAPAVVVARVDEAVAEVDATQAQLEPLQARLLVLEDAVTRSLEARDEALTRLASAERSALRQALVRQAPPLGSPRPTDGVPGGARVGGMGRSALARADAYLRASFAGVLATAVLWLALAAVLRRTPAVAAPAAAALLVALVLSSPLRPDPPLVVREALLLVAVAAALALLRGQLAPRRWAAGFALAALFALDLSRSLLGATPAVEQGILAAGMTAAAGVLLWAVADTRAASGPSPQGPSRTLRATRLVARVLAGICAVSALAAVLGFVEFADLFGAGALAVACAGVGVAGLRVALEACLRAALSAADRAPALGSGGARLLDLFAFAVFAFVALDRFGLALPLGEAAARAIRTPVEIGALRFSLESALAFAGVLAAAWLASRALDTALDTAVYRRMTLPRGVPYALSTLARYAVLLAGLLLALTALGFDLTRLTLLLSAFGLGLGFGLQQVIHNFVSGLILLFERPVQIGDTIQLGELVGDVARIGIRSSTVRTAEGAEVIVPNSAMTEEHVTNWTLSDRRRRVTLVVAAAHGADPTQVLALLRDVAAQDERVAAAPPPEALFVQLGRETLDFELRIWTEDAAWARVRSDLAVAAERVLREAQVPLPRPERYEPPG